MQAKEKEIKNPEIQQAIAAYHQGNPKKAEEICTAVLSKNPNEVGALNVISGACMQLGKTGEAIHYLQKACSLQPKNGALQANLARLYNQTGNINQALNCLFNAIMAEPDKREFKIFFSALIQGTSINTYNTEVEKTLALCLADKQVMHQRLLLPWYSLLKITPNLSHLWKLIDINDYSSFSKKFKEEDYKEALNYPLLLEGIKRLIVNQIEFEKALTFLRRYFLENLDKSLYEDYTPFLTALSQYCFLNEYSFATRQDELAQIEKLNLQNKDHLLILSCYKPLYKEENAKEYLSLLKEQENEEFLNLAKIQIEEPLEEKEIIKSIPSLSSINNEISTKVRSQYEENPYPRWRYLDIPVIRDDIKELAKNKEILVAGCGTGKEALNIASYFPYANVTAIDLSMASIAYGARKTKELNVNNIEFMHADILELEKLDKKFDLILSSGVLHHMEDPVAGWKILIKKLNPGGLLKLALYSETARKDIINARKWVEEQNLDTSNDSIRLFRSKMMALQDDNPLKKITNRLDFYSLSSCRDLVFHFQEHRFTVPQLKAIFEDLELEMVGMKLHNNQLRQGYLKMFPEDPNFTDFDCLHKFEEINQMTFASMYVFWCGKKEEHQKGILPDWLRFIGNN
jgi:2-polyprenyl-3-methyl-5-hydroxy-6-metoxy-1,4-benzoquinol methylase